MNVKIVIFTWEFVKGYTKYINFENKEHFSMTIYSGKPGEG